MLRAEVDGGGVFGHDHGMRIAGWTLGVVLVAACGSKAGAPQQQPSEAGKAGMAAAIAADAGSPHDAGATDSGAHDAAIGGTKADPPVEAGSGGKETGGSGGKPAAGHPAPSGGQGGGGTGGTITAPPTGGTPALGDHVLWSQSWSVAIHEASANGGYNNATMGLELDAGSFCRFGGIGAASGTSQTFMTDGTCITASSARRGAAYIYDSNGVNPNGGGGSAELVGWVDAVSGHTVTGIRRTQTYTIQLLGSGSTSYNYADFTGTWEAIGH